jgi:hypothetical protein
VRASSGNEVHEVSSELTAVITSTERAHMYATGLYGHRGNATFNFNATSNSVYNKVDTCNLFMLSPSGHLTPWDVFVNIPIHDNVLDEHSTMPSGFLCNDFEITSFLSGDSTAPSCSRFSVNSMCINDISIFQNNLWGGGIFSISQYFWLRSSFSSHFITKCFF